jgi:hypothetical protein
MFCLLLEKGVGKQVECARLFSFTKHFRDAIWSEHREKLNVILLDLLPASDAFRRKYLERFNALTMLWDRSSPTGEIDHYKNLSSELRLFIRWQERQLFQHLQSEFENKVEDLTIAECRGEVCSRWPDPFWAEE